MAAAFLIIDDPVTGRTAVLLQAGERFSVGRAPTNRIVVHDERASRMHAEIAESQSGWTVRDLDSRNGTLLRGRPVTAVQPLAAGDVIAIGSVQLTFTDRDPALDDETNGTAPGGGMSSADLQAWQASITHRQTRSRLLENLHEAAATVPRVGRAAADLCRLAFSLGRIEDLAGAAKLALETAMRGVQAGRGIALLPPRVADLTATAIDGHGTDALAVVASVPTPWPAGATPAGVVAAVLASDEAVVAAGGSPTSSDPLMSTISAPIRVRGRAVGVMHVEVQEPGQQATADDLEFTLAVCDALGLAAENLVAKEELSTRLASTADENERLRQRLGEDSRMVVASPVLQGIVGQVQRVATTKATVLVRGESGVGKELVARSIHDSSDRRNGPFVCLNCAALSETLLESELFGHEKGSFTGATERKIGKFEQAHRGTLMLDEIGEMSPAIQAKFLRVLEGHPFERVGGSARVQVDVRVVAATNRNLEDAVASGGFRRDLYFRLKVVEILIPPLRRRPEDVEALARHFLERFAAETGRKVRGFTPQALESMQAYPWPGNIRELRNCIERAVVLAQDEWIDAADVVLTQLAVPGDTGREQAMHAGPFVPQTIDEVEHRHVMATLEAVGGNKTKAASILGIERSTLDRKLAKWAVK